MTDDLDPIFDDETLGGTLGRGSDVVLAGQYRVVREIGRGSMGTVFLAEHLALERPVAIKMPSVLLAHDPEAIARLKAEAVIVMRLVHDHIVQVRDFVETGSGGFLVMDHVDGRSLREELRSTGPMSEADVVRLFRPLAAALDHAHGKGVIHRDVKPANILIRAEDGQALLADFGIADQVHDALARLTGRSPSGTLPYMSPEQLHGHPPDPRQDVYGLAATMYECLAGRPPFRGRGLAHRIEHDEPPPLPGPVTPLARAVMRGLAKNPARRPANCRALLAERSRPVSVPGPRRVWPWLLVPALVIVVLVVASALPEHGDESGGPDETASRDTPARTGPLVESDAEVGDSTPPTTREAPVDSGDSLRPPTPDRVERLPRGIPRRPAEATTYDPGTLDRMAALVASPDWGPATWSGEGLLETVHEKTTLRFVLIPGTGEAGYEMGSRPGEAGCDADEALHRVVIGPFLLSRTECTQSAWVAAGGTNRSGWTGPNLPVENVSWLDASSWLSGAGLRFPTEAEWEYACRAGTGTAYWSGDDEVALSRAGWFRGNSTRRTHRVGEKDEANAFGLLDMHGNVWEWCADVYVESYAGAPTDGRARTGGDAGKRVDRGGSWYCVGRNCRSANRRGNAPGDRFDYIGLRPAASLP